MTRTAEELAAEYTRRELEKMAEKLGIGTIGTDKLQLSKDIIEAKEKEPEIEIFEAEVPGKTPVKGKLNPRIGKKGVYAKCAAIDAQVKENEEAVAIIRTGVVEIQKGIKDMRSAIDDKATEMQKGIDEMYRGIDEIQKGIDEMQKSISAQVKANGKAVAKMGMGIKEMHSGIEEMESRYREFQNRTADYIKDFYYG
ncbi:MAG: hypothetical protein SCH66_02990 [Methanolobus sp.]|nr:hypothetical protein [Methanolobus sp.]